MQSDELLNERQSQTQTNMIVSLSDLGRSLYEKKNSLFRIINTTIGKTFKIRFKNDHCDCPRLKPSERCQRAFQILLHWYKQPEHQYLQQQYQFLTKKKGQTNCLQQIAKDVGRTVDSQYSTQFLKKLKIFLQNYSKHRVKIGYVQGLNFIAAALLYHSQEWVAFALLDMLLFKQDLKKFYINELNGLIKELKTLQAYLMLEQPVLASHLESNKISAEMFAVPWYISLFTLLIPIDLTIIIFQRLDVQGIVFLHKVSIAYLASKAIVLLSHNEQQLMLQLNSENYSKTRNQDWDLILQAAINMNFK